MDDYTPIIIGTAILALVAAVIFLCLRLARKRRPIAIDVMEGREFEQYCAQLLAQHGFLEVDVTRGSRDFGADILAQREGITYAIQCKRYDSPVGVHAVQEVYAARDYYDCMVAAVMSNQYFTEPAVQLARKLKVMLWDRDYLEEMASEDSFSVKN